MRHTTEEPMQELANVPAAETPAESLGERQASNRIVSSLRLIWDNRGFLLKAGVVGLVLGGLLAFFVISKRYQSRVLLMPPDSAQGSSGLAMAAAMMARGGTGSSLGGLASDLLGVKTSGALFIGILQSRTVQDRLIERFSLRSVYHVRFWDQARKILDENTEMSEDRKSGIISLAITDGDPQRAAALGRAYIQELDRLVAQVSTSAARREREFIQERLKTVKQDLDAASKDFSEFSSKNMTIDIKEQGKAMVEAAATLEGNLIAADSELKMLETIYADQNVRVRSARARVTELRRQLEQLGGKELGAADGSSSGADSIYPSIRRLPLLGVTYADLFRRVKIQEAVYEALTQQYEMAKVQEAKEIPSVKVLDSASVPERKSYPPRLLITVMGAFLAMGCASILLLGNAQWQERNPQDPGVVLTEEVLAFLRQGVRGGSLNGYGWRSLGRKLRERSGSDSPRD
jgi:capsule polysaccharide export protein KpsE/RkpR